jgi:hypothetical protein
MIPMYFNAITILKSFNKSIIMYDLHSHRDMVVKISELELSILERYNHFLKMYKKCQKIPVYNLTTQLNSCSVKLFDDIEYDIDELEDYSSEDMDEGFDDFDIKRKRGGVDYSEEEFPDSNKIDAKTFDFGFGDEFTHDSDEERFDFEEVDEEVLPDFMEKLNESLNMFERFKKYN